MCVCVCVCVCEVCVHSSLSSQACWRAARVCVCVRERERGMRAPLLSSRRSDCVCVCVRYACTLLSPQE